MMSARADQQCNPCGKQLSTPNKREKEDVRLDDKQQARRVTRLQLERISQSKSIKAKLQTRHLRDVVCKVDFSKDSAKALLLLADASPELFEFIEEIRCKLAS
jgi:hypothetical protein